METILPKKIPSRKQKNSSLLFPVSDDGNSQDGDDPAANDNSQGHSKNIEVVAITSSVIRVTIARVTLKRLSSKIPIIKIKLT